jgi:hypothetical protein
VRIAASYTSGACGGSGAGFGVQEPGISPTGGAIPRASGHLYHRAGERGFRRYFWPVGEEKRSRAVETKCSST